MKLNKKELKKLQYDFNSICNRLLQADYQDYPEVLGKFLKFINNASIFIEIRVQPIAPRITPKLTPMALKVALMRQQ